MTATQVKPKKSGRGGARKGSGRKKKEPTCILNLKIPVSLKNKLKEKGIKPNKLIIIYLTALAEV